MNSAINQESGDSWHLYHGDCCEVLGLLPDDSMDFSVFSPPFASLYVYSDSERDMGNSENDEQFFEHFGFLVDLLLKKIKPGRLVSVHCMNLPSTISHQGYIGIRDFRGDIIRRFVESGFYYHSEVCIWKDPVVAMQRTKALGLLHKQIKKDSTMSRQGIPDYICTFRKPGKNENPVAGEFNYFAGDVDEFNKRENPGNLSIDIWQRYASPVWMDIKQSNTLNSRMGRDNNDERHVCPLQLDVIERCLQLWSNPGDVVLSPFAGIGSEGVASLRAGRKFVGVELKDSYFDAAVGFLRSEEKEQNVPALF
jgi:DNA modification methylase